MGRCPVPRESLAPSDWELATALFRDAGYSSGTANAVVGLMNVAGLRHLASATTGVDLVRLHNLRVLEAGERAVAGVVGSVDAGARAYAATKMSGIYEGKEISIGRNTRIAPLGNRTGHPLGKWPHYHSRRFSPSGEVKPGQGIGRHRPFETKSTDTSFWDRF